MIRRLDTLYKLDNNGKIRTWTAEINKTAWRTVTGILDGKTVTSGWKTVRATNVGRSNERDVQEQAEFEAEASRIRRLESGYFDDIKKVGSFDKFNPMLAGSYSSLKKPLEFPVYSQPKLDGIRCIARHDGLWTRNGKRHLSVPHIEESLNSFFSVFPKMVLDGELYNHELRDDFNTISSIVRKSRPTDGDLIRSQMNIQFHIYDCVLIDPEESFIKRNSFLNCFRSRIANVIVPTTECCSQEELDEKYSEYIALGYEGQMIRFPESPYEKKRSKYLIKRKEFITEEYKVVSIEEGNGTWTGAIKRFRLVDESGNSFSAGVRGSLDEMRKLKRESDKGNTPQWCTLRYFELTPDGIPRFPVVIDYGYSSRED